MKIIITETQNLFLKRRLEEIDNLVKLALRRVNPEEYNYNDYVEEIVWQVLDEYTESGGVLNIVAQYVRDTYRKEIKTYYLKHTK